LSWFYLGGFEFQGSLFELQGEIPDVFGEIMDIEESSGRFSLPFLTLNLPGTAL